MLTSLVVVIIGVCLEIIICLMLDVRSLKRENAGLNGDLARAKGRIAELTDENSIWHRKTMRDNCDY